MPYPAKDTTSFYVWQPSITQTNTDMGSLNEITETFIVEKKGSTTSQHTEVQFDRADFLLLAQEAVTPDIGQYYGIWNPTAVNTGSWHEYARCRGFAIAPLPDGRASITTSWATQYTANPSSVTAEDPIILLPGSIESQSGTRVMELYRTGWTTPPTATVDKSSANIGGTAAAKGRKGIPVEVAQTKIRLRLVKDCTQIGADMENVIIYFTLGMVGKRHSATAGAPFLGFPTQALSCTGINIVKLEGEFYEMVFDFLFDQFYEHEQVPEFNNYGEPALASGGTELADVRWNRMAKDTFDFNEAFFVELNNPGTVISTDQQAHVLKGYWI
jgi:hypothetical protein